MADKKPVDSASFTNTHRQAVSRKGTTDSTMDNVEY